MKESKNKKTIKYCITFAGAVGSSKTPIANYLSGQLGLPVYNNDAVRSEVIEDLGKLDINEHKKRKEQRIKQILQAGYCFILDASVDREWEKISEYLVDSDYKCFIISLDLSKNLLTKLYQDKGYNESLSRIDQLIKDHEKFIKNYQHEINLSIDDNNFNERLKVSLETVFAWLKNLLN